jgi:hypothetical protein
MFNLLVPEFGILILAHPVCKMRIIHEQKKLALWNKQNFEEKKTEIIQHVKKLSTFISWKEIYKMGNLEGSGVPVLYIGRTVPKG